MHPINGLFSRTTPVSWHQKGKTILDFTEARDDGVAVASAGPYANHLHLAPDSRPTSPPPCRPSNSVKALKVEEVLTATYIRNTTAGCKRRPSLRKNAVER